MRGTSFESSFKGTSSLYGYHPSMCMDIKGKRVLVVGLGRTGISVARFLKGKGARVMVTDLRSDSELQNSIRCLSSLNIGVETGRHTVKNFLTSDLIILSPGVPGDIDPLIEAKRNGIKVISEIELAYNFINKPIIGVTGTNGKTTTTSLLEKIFSLSETKVWVGGNIGNPLIEFYTERGRDREIKYIVCEVSSFQLEQIERFRPFIGIFLNISEDHLDRYPSFREYAETKCRLFMNQSNSDFAILNVDDPIISTMLHDLPSRRIGFSTQRSLGEGIFLRDREIIFSMGGLEEDYPLSNIKIKGLHNVENILAAIVTARLCGIDRDIIIRAIEEFKGLPHRMEFVRDFKGVAYFNDSKGTNTGAVARAIMSMEAPVVLILGGMDKGIDYRVLNPVIEERVKSIILFGEAKNRIERGLSGKVPYIKVDTLGEAVESAYRKARAGDVVLFSPACSSFDMFRDYKDRGDQFKNIVMSLK